MRAIALLVLLVGLPAWADPINWAAIDREVKVAAAEMPGAAPTVEPRDVNVGTAAITTKEGQSAVVVGGCWLSEAKCIEQGKKVADLVDQNKTLRASAGSLPMTVVWVALGLGLVSGFVAARLIYK